MTNSLTPRFKKIPLVLLLFVLTTVGYAQKRPLDHDVYDGWQSISTSGMTPSGNFIYYAVSPQEGDARLHITDSKGNALSAIDRLPAVSVSPDGNFLVGLVKPTFMETRQARIDKKKSEDMPKDTLAILSLANLSVTKVPAVKSFQVPEEGGSYIAYLADAAKKTAEAGSDSTASDSTARRAGRGGTAKTATLHLRNLETGEETAFERVDTYYFSKDGNLLVYVRKEADKDSIGADAGVYAYNLLTQENRHLKSGKGTYKNITLDETGTQIAFTADYSPEKSLSTAFELYYYTSGQDSATSLVRTGSRGVPQAWHVSGDGNVRFSKNGEKLFFGIAPIPPVKDTTLVEFEHAKVDIWHWKDDYLQTQQLVNLRRDQNRSYLAVVYPRGARVTIPLADEELASTRLTEDADNEYLLATTDAGRRIQTQWINGAYQDVYLVSTVDGSRHRVAENIRGSFTLSPEGKYVVWFDRSDGNWYSYSTANQSRLQLNTDLPVSFANEDNDSPDDPNSYGIAAWAAGDELLYINDKYDIWEFNPADGERRILTNGYGRSQKTTLRYVDAVNSGNRRSMFGGSPAIIDPTKPVLLSAFNHITKENGFYETSTRRNRNPEELISGPYTYRRVSTTEDAGHYIYTKENYIASPDLYVSNNFKNETKLSVLNPQQASYNWGTAELIRWTTPNGHEADGIVYKPEDFDPNKKYPVIAYFYELVSQGLYSYIPPTPTPSRLNISFFVSNGYIVLAPDIRYEIGYPGKSAEEFVNSGMEELKKMPWVDSTKLAIQGQSWGGYQVAHLITRTDMYAAAWSGAPVVNMTSAYGGIRWQTGLNRQFQYERTQSRIGATLWENLDLYIENSPLFHLDKVNTPVVIMHNDEDGAVPWYQGIEMFTALRRLEKPVWMLNYNGDAHNLVKRENRKDIQRRQQQFFDHFLKGEPAAPWIEHGVPAVRKGIDWGFE